MKTCKRFCSHIEYNVFMGAKNVPEQYFKASFLKYGTGTLRGAKAACQPCRVQHSHLKLLSVGTTFILNLQSL
jgi:hypothetical protein